MRSRWLDIGQFVCLFLGFLWTERNFKSRSIKNAIKANVYPAILTEGIISYIHERISPLWEQSGQSRAGNLAQSGSQSDHRIRVIFPARGDSHIIRNSIVYPHWLLLTTSRNYAYERDPRTAVVRDKQRGYKGMSTNTRGGG